MLIDLSYGHQTTLDQLWQISSYQHFLTRKISEEQKLGNSYLWGQVRKLFEIRRGRHRCKELRATTSAHLCFMMCILTRIASLLLLGFVASQTQIVSIKPTRSTSAGHRCGLWTALLNLLKKDRNSLSHHLFAFMKLIQKPSQARSSLRFLSSANRTELALLHFAFDSQRHQHPSPLRQMYQQKVEKFLCHLHPRSHNWSPQRGIQRLLIHSHFPGC